MKVSLFVTCLGDQFFAEAAADAVRLLRSLGADVDFPEDQTCCGQPAYNAGYRAEALTMAEHTLRVFEGAEYVVLPSGSCATMLRVFYPRLVEGNGEAAGAAGPGETIRERVRDLAERTYELSQFIVNVLGVEDLGAGLTGRRIAYHQGCHALRELGSVVEPRTLLQRAGATLVPWPAEQECCGFGGLFSVKVPEVSSAMADRKLDSLPPVDLLTSGDGGCLLQLAGRAGVRELDVPVRHIASVLLEATRGGS